MVVQIKMVWTCLLALFNGCALQLLEKSPQKRLCSIESLQRLPYFRDVNFDGLCHRQVCYYCLTVRQSCLLNCKVHNYIASKYKYNLCSAVSNTNCLKILSNKNVCCVGEILNRCDLGFLTSV